MRAKILFVTIFMLMKLTQELREFLEHAGKVLILENDEPKFVVSSFDAYLELVRKVRDQEPVHMQRTRELNTELEELSKENFFVSESGEAVFSRSVQGDLYKEP